MNRRDSCNASGLIPAHVRAERRVSWREEEGLVVLLVPRFGAGRVGRVLARLFGGEPIHVRLDAMGSRAWQALDGQTPIGTVAGVLREAFGGQAGEMDRRLDRFLRQLYRNGWVRFTR